MTHKGFTTVLEAADMAEVGWGGIADRPEGEVYVPLFPGRGEPQGVFTQADWGQVHRAVVRVGVTLVLLHPGFGLVNAPS